MPFIITGPGVLASRVDHSVVSNVDWLPTVASLARVQVPRGQLLRGQDLSPILRGELRHQTQRQQPLYWRGGGGSPPCWNRSPPMAMREGDWKLLFAPRKISEPPSAPAAYRVELYNVSLGALESQGGSFLESANEAGSQPEVVERMMARMMAWHSQAPCPFGNRNNSREGVCTWLEIPFAGCARYPLPGKPVASCNGKPCPPAGHSGPCVCNAPPAADGLGSEAEVLYARQQALNVE